MVTKLFIAVVVLLSTHPILAQEKSITIGHIEFYGTAGMDVKRIRNELPVHIGDEISVASVPDVKDRIKQSVKKTIHLEPTDVAMLCCDNQNRLVAFIGLPGKNYRQFQYNRSPKGSAQLAPQVLTIYREAMDLLLPSIQTNSREEDATGYALSTYPPLRAKQMAMHEYAVQNEELIQRVLADAADAQQREVAAELVGYGQQNTQQVRALVRASRDVNDGVRNNAMRALGVLVDSKKVSAQQISPEPFIQMLNSGIWTDRNKGAYLLQGLTLSRDRRLLASIHKKAFVSLYEMARWQDPSHAGSARYILGRIAGIDEKRLVQLIAEDDVDTILRAFRGRLYL